MQPLYFLVFLLCLSAALPVDNTSPFEVAHTTGHVLTTERAFVTEASTPATMDSAVPSTTAESKTDFEHGTTTVAEILSTIMSPISTESESSTSEESPSTLFQTIYATRENLSPSMTYSESFRNNKSTAASAVSTIAETTPTRESSTVVSQVSTDFQSSTRITNQTTDDQHSATKTITITPTAVQSQSSTRPDISSLNTDRTYNASQNAASISTESLVAIESKSMDETDLLNHLPITVLTPNFAITTNMELQSISMESHGPVTTDYESKTATIHQFVVPSQSFQSQTAAVSTPIVLPTKVPLTMMRSSTHFAYLPTVTEPKVESANGYSTIDESPTAIAYLANLDHSSSASPLATIKPPITAASIEASSLIYPSLPVRSERYTILSGYSTTAKVPLPIQYTTISHESFTAIETPITMPMKLIRSTVSKLQISTTIGNEFTITTKSAISIELPTVTSYPTTNQSFFPLIPKSSNLKPSTVIKAFSVMITEPLFSDESYTITMATQVVESHHNMYTKAQNTNSVSDTPPRPYSTTTESSTANLLYTFIIPTATSRPITNNQIGTSKPFSPSGEDSHTTEVLPALVFSNTINSLTTTRSMYSTTFMFMSSLDSSDPTTDNQGTLMTIELQTATESQSVLSSNVEVTITLSSTTTQSQSSNIESQTAIGSNYQTVVHIPSEEIPTYSRKPHITPSQVAKSSQMIPLTNQLFFPESLSTVIHPAATKSSSSIEIQPTMYSHRTNLPNVTISSVTLVTEMPVELPTKATFSSPMEHSSTVGYKSLSINDDRGLMIQVSTVSQTNTELTSSVLSTTGESLSVLSTIAMATMPIRTAIIPLTVTAVRTHANDQSTSHTVSLYPQASVISAANYLTTIMHPSRSIATEDQQITRTFPGNNSSTTLIPAMSPVTSNVSTIKNALTASILLTSRVSPMITVHTATTNLPIPTQLSMDSLNTTASVSAKEVPTPPNSPRTLFIEPSGIMMPIATEEFHSSTKFLNTGLTMTTESVTITEPEFQMTSITASTTKAYLTATKVLHITAFPTPTASSNTVSVSQSDTLVPATTSSNSEIITGHDTLSFFFRETPPHTTTVQVMNISPTTTESLTLTQPVNLLSTSTGESLFNVSPTTEYPSTTESESLHNSSPLVILSTANVDPLHTVNTLSTVIPQKSQMKATSLTLSESMRRTKSSAIKVSTVAVRATVTPLAIPKVTFVEFSSGSVVEASIIATPTKTELPIVTKSMESTPTIMVNLELQYSTVVPIITPSILTLPPSKKLSVVSDTFQNTTTIYSSPTIPQTSIKPKIPPIAPTTTMVSDMLKHPLPTSPSVTSKSQITMESMTELSSPIAVYYSGTFETQNTVAESSIIVTPSRRANISDVSTVADQTLTHLITQIISTTTIESLSATKLIGSSSTSYSRSIAQSPTVEASSTTPLITKSPFVADSHSPYSTPSPIAFSVTSNVSTTGTTTVESTVSVVFSKSPSATMASFTIQPSNAMSLKPTSLEFPVFTPSGISVLESYQDSISTSAPVTFSTMIDFSTVSPSVSLEVIPTFYFEHSASLAESTTIFQTTAESQTDTVIQTVSSMESMVSQITTPASLTPAEYSDPQNTQSMIEQTPFKDFVDSTVHQVIYSSFMIKSTAYLGSHTITPSKTMALLIPTTTMGSLSAIELIGSSSTSDFQSLAQSPTVEASPTTPLITKSLFVADSHHSPYSTLSPITFSVTSNVSTTGTTVGPSNSNVMIQTTELQFSMEGLSTSNVEHHITLSQGNSESLATTTSRMSPIDLGSNIRESLHVTDVVQITTNVEKTQTVTESGSAAPLAPSISQAKDSSISSESNPTSEILLIMQTMMLESFTVKPSTNSPNKMIPTISRSAVKESASPSISQAEGSNVTLEIQSTISESHTPSRTTKPSSVMDVSTVAYQTLSNYIPFTTNLKPSISSIDLTAETTTKVQTVTNPIPFTAEEVNQTFTRFERFSTTSLITPSTLESSTKFKQLTITESQSTTSSIAMTSELQQLTIIPTRTVFPAVILSTSEESSTTDTVLSISDNSLSLSIIHSTGFLKESPATTSLMINPLTMVESASMTSKYLTTLSMTVSVTSPVSITTFSEYQHTSSPAIKQSATLESLDVTRSVTSTTLFMKSSMNVTISQSNVVEFPATSPFKTMELKASKRPDSTEPYHISHPTKSVVEMLMTTSAFTKTKSRLNVPKMSDLPVSATLASMNYSESPDILVLSTTIFITSIKSQTIVSQTLSYSGATPSLTKSSLVTLPLTASVGDKLASAMHQTTGPSPMATPTVSQMEGFSITLESPVSAVSSESINITSSETIAPTTTQPSNAMSPTHILSTSLKFPLFTPPVISALESDKDSIPTSLLTTLPKMIEPTLFKDFVVSTMSQIKDYSLMMNSNLYFGSLTITPSKTMAPIITYISTFITKSLRTTTVIGSADISDSQSIAQSPTVKAPPTTPMITKSPFVTESLQVPYSIPSSIMFSITPNVSTIGTTVKPSNVGVMTHTTKSQISMDFMSFSNMEHRATLTTGTSEFSAPATSQTSSTGLGSTSRQSVPLTGVTTAVFKSQIMTESHPLAPSVSQAKDTSISLETIESQITIQATTLESFTAVASPLTSTTESPSTMSRTIKHSNVKEYTASTISQTEDSQVTLESTVTSEYLITRQVITSFRTQPSATPIADIHSTNILFPSSPSISKASGNTIEALDVSTHFTQLESSSMIDYHTNAKPSMQDSPTVTTQGVEASSFLNTEVHFNPTPTSSFIIAAEVSTSTPSTDMTIISKPYELAHSTQLRSTNGDKHLSTMITMSQSTSIESLHPAVKSGITFIQTMTSLMLHKKSLSNSRSPSATNRFIGVTHSPITGSGIAMTTAPINIGSSEVTMFGDIVNPTLSYISGETPSVSDHDVPKVTATPTFTPFYSTNIKHSTAMVLEPTRLPATTNELSITVAHSTTVTSTMGATTTTESNQPTIPPTKLSCSYESRTAGSVTFIWPETSINSNATFTCPNNPQFKVARECDSGGKWKDYDEQGCGLLSEEFDKLMRRSEMLTNNSLSETAEMLSVLVQQTVNKSVEQSTENLNEISSTLANVANYVNKSDVLINKTVVEDIVEAVSSLLQWTPVAFSPQSSSQIVQSVEMIATQYTQQIPLNTATNFTAPSLTISTEKAAMESLQSVGRDIAFDHSGKPDKAHVTPGQLFPQQDAAISLPSSLFKNIDSHAMPNISLFFGIYENATLFPIGGENGDSSAPRRIQVCSRVLAATVGQNISIEHLKPDESVTVTFRLQKKIGMFTASGSETCVSWDFNVQNWTPRGCYSNKSNDNQVIVCHCNHLTNFAVVVDICSRPENCEPTTIADSPTSPTVTLLNSLNDSFTNLTTKTYGEAVSNLAKVIEGTEQSAVNQNAAVLESVASYFTTLATFVTDVNVTINTTVVGDIVQVVSSLLQWQPDNVIVDSSSSVVESFEMVVAQYAQQLPLNGNETFTFPSLTVVTELRSVETLEVEGRSFTIGNKETVLRPEGHVRSGELSSHQVAAVNLPASLFKQIDNHTNVGIFFMLYETPVLFPVDRKNDVNRNETEVGSHILSITVGPDLNFQDLTHNITIVFRLTPKINLTVPGAEICVSWDFDHQVWTTQGCTTSIGKDGIVTCNCNHLTNFAVLVDICLRQEECAPSKVDSVLTFISYIGMSISIIFLTITILTLLIFKEVRQKDISKYHIQLSISVLLMLVVSFVLVAMSAEDVNVLYGGCLTVSALVHYFTLVAVMWMGAEALLMFQKLVYVFYRITTRFIISVSIVCWTVPIAPVLIPLIVDLATGHDIADDITVKRANTIEDISYCFLSHVGAFWGAFFAPILIVMVFNVIIFIRVIIVMVRHTRDTASRQGKAVSNKTILRLLISISGVMLLFGLTWTFAILTFSVIGLRETFQILFVIFNSFQGFFIFIFVCILNKEVLESWWEIISCRTYQSKLLHPSPIKVIAADKYNQANTGSTGFSSSSGAKYTSQTSTTKDSCDSNTLNVSTVKSLKQANPMHTVPNVNRVISVEERKDMIKHQVVDATMDIKEECIILSDQNMLQLQEQAASLSEPSRIISNQYKEKEKMTTDTIRPELCVVNVTVELEEECTSLGDQNILKPLKQGANTQYKAAAGATISKEGGHIYNENKQKKTVTNKMTTSKHRVVNVRVEMEEECTTQYN